MPPDSVKVQPGRTEQHTVTGHLTQICRAVDGRLGHRCPGPVAGGQTAAVRILSIQSSVAYGHVGNSAATFPLQRLGHEVWPVLTVHFSNHTGYGQWRGIVFDAAVVAEVLQGMDERGVFDSVDAVLTGYLGSPGVAEVVLSTVSRIRSLRSDLVYCCDPVMGDVGRGLFVLPGLPELIAKRVVPTADVLTPNLFELAYLSGHPVESLDSAKALLTAIDSLRSTGPSTILVTSVNSPNRPDQIGMVAVSETGAWAVWTPRRNVVLNGLGDVTAALFLAHLAAGPAEALRRLASSIAAIVDETARVGAQEIQLVAAQEAIAAPAGEFPVEDWSDRLRAGPRG